MKTKRRTTKPRPANAWPAWKLRLYLPEVWRRWEVLRVVQLSPDEWQLQVPSGKPAGVGLFASRAGALAWATKHAERVVMVPAT